MHELLASKSLPDPTSPPPPTGFHVQSQPCVLVALAVCLGVIFDRVFDWPWWVYSSVGVGCIAVWWFFSRKQSFVLSSQVLLVTWAATAAIWHQYHWNLYPENNIQFAVRADPVLVCAQLKLLSEPRRMASEASDVLNPIRANDRVRVMAEVQRIRDGQQWKVVSGRTQLIIHQGKTSLACGDVVQVFGRLAAADSTRNPGQFDFRSYSRSQRMLTRIHVYQTEAIVKLKNHSGWNLSRVKSRIRRQLDSQIWRHLSPERAGFASAILLGNREQLSSQRRQQFLLTGTVHLLAISGLHLGILAGVFFVIFRLGLMRRSTALLCTMIFVLFFAWLVDFRPPIMRASVLILLFCAARLRGREGFSFNLLALAGVIVLAINPSDLFQIGPQLSFLAVATMIFCRRWTEWKVEQDPLRRLINNTRSGPIRAMKWFWKKALLACKVSALIWIIAIPLVSLRFHLFAPVGLVLNPLLMIPIAIALYSGLGVLVLDWWPWAASICGWSCDLSLEWIEWMVAGGQDVAYGHFWTSGPGDFSVAIFYLLILVFVAYLPIRIPGRWICLGGLLWVVFAWIGPNAYQQYCEQQRENAEVIFIDAGHGGSVVLRLPHSQTVVYDAGSLASAEYGADNISNALWNCRVQHIDALVISHADIDHFNSAVELVQRFSVGVVYLSPTMLKSSSPGVKHLLEQFQKRKVNVRALVGGYELLLKSEDVQIHVLGPPPQGTFSNDNSDSLILSVEMYGKKLLLPGDLEGPGLHRLLSMPARKFDIVMAPHHGSLHSDPVGFTDWAKPEHVVVSASSRRVHAQALEQFAQQGCKVWATGQDGAIRCIFGEQPTKVQKWIRYPSVSREYYSERGFDEEAAADGD